MHDGILVGVGTALNDDPQLNSKGTRPFCTWCETLSTRGRFTARYLPVGVPHSLPIPIVMDRRCRLGVDCKLIRNYAEGKGKQPWVICSRTDDGEVLERMKKLESAGARIIESDANGNLVR